MAKNTNQSAAKSNNTILNIIVIAIIAVFVAVGVYATYGKIADGLEEKAITNGEKEATVSYLAKTAGMTVEDYLAQYGLELGDIITKDTTESELLDNMTIENYLKYTGDSQTAEEVIEGTGLTDKVTKDTLWKDFLPQVPVVSVIGEESFNSLKEQLNLGDDVTIDMPYGEFEELMNSKLIEASGETGEAAQDSEEQNTEAETDAAEENSEATQSNAE